MTRPAPLEWPSPWAGMNTRDGIAALKPNEARLLENWLPVGSSLQKRKGYASSSSGMSGDVETLVVHRDSSGSELLAVASGSIYDASGATASSLASGYTDSRFQTVTYGGYTFGVNGTDTPWRYDGSAIGATGFTGITLTNASNINVVRDRIWIIDDATGNPWYAAIGAVTGALTEFDLDQVVKGGDCIAVGTHSRDAGDGMDDFTVFIMDSGQIAVYSGDVSSTFSLVGVYYMPKPVGKQCLVNIGGQLAVLTNGGLIPLQAAMTGVAFDIYKLNDFGKVSPSLRDDVDNYQSIDNWSLAFHDGFVYISIPTVSGSSSKIWVYNTQTGAWSTFSNVPSACVVEWDAELYFGAWSDGNVYKFQGGADISDPIRCLSRGAFGKVPGSRRIRPTQVRFDIDANGSTSVRYCIDTDYKSTSISMDSISLSTSGTVTPWGSAWGSSWSASLSTVTKWYTVCTGEGNGLALALALELSSTATDLRWFQSQVMIVPGGHK